MNKKAFTIVELLAVVIMISVLSVIIMPLISNYLEKSKEEYNLKLKQQMLVSGKNFYADYKDRVPTDVSAKTIDYVFSSELSTLKYLKGEFKDADEVSCEEKSYVVASNEGNGVKYYPCLICGDDEYKYMTNEEKLYCDKIKNLDNTKINYPTCEVIEEESKITDNDVEIKIKAGDNGYITRVYVVDEKGEITEKLEESEKGNEITKVVKFTEYGINKIYAMDNNDNKVYCTTFDYKKPTKTTLNTKMYLVSKEQYDTYKNTGVPESELTTEYSGEDWTDKYVYVKLDYYTSQYLSMKIGDTDIIGKKYFFIADQGEKTTTVKAVNVSEKEVTASVTTKIDRTAPTVSLSNTSGGSWTNKAVTVTATITETGGSGIEKIEYSSDKSTWYDSWTSITSNIATKEWAKENRNVTMHVRVADKAGNESQISSTNIKQDVTAPPKPTVTNTSGGSWTNVAVTVGATSADASSGSGTDHLEYNIGSGWVKDWTSTGTNTASKNWSKANRNYSMQIKAIDKAGNTSEIATSAVKIDINPPSMGTHCHYSGRKFRYYFSDTGGSGVYAYKWGYCYSICPNCPSSYMCSYNSVANRLSADSWHYATYKETNYAIATNSSARTIQVTTRWIIRDLAGNSATYGNYTDTWYYGGSYSPSASC